MPLALGERSYTGTCARTQSRNPICSRNFATTEQTPPQAVSGLWVKTICACPTQWALVRTVLWLTFLYSFRFELTGAK